MTTSARVGFHQYTFPKSDNSHIILDLMAGIYNYEDKNVWTYLHVVNDTLVAGYRQTNGWAKNRTLYFAMKFSKPFIAYGNRNYSKKEVYRGFWGKFNQSKNFPEISAQKLRAYFDFKTEAGDKIKIKFALSPVSMEGALNNMQTELPGWDFEKAVQNGQALWEKELTKITIQSKSTAEKQNFYTAMYALYGCGWQVQRFRPKCAPGRWLYQLHYLFFVGHLPRPASAFQHHRAKKER